MGDLYIDSHNGMYHIYSRVEDKHITSCRTIGEINQRFDFLTNNMGEEVNSGTKSSQDTETDAEFYIEYQRGLYHIYIRSYDERVYSTLGFGEVNKVLDTLLSTNDKIFE